MSNYIPREFINGLLSRCDLVDVIDARVPLRKKGNNYSACCPFHNEKTPSFIVSPAKQIYHCFGCQASGNAISFLMEYDRLSFPEAIEELAKTQGMVVPRQQQQTLQSKNAPDYYQWMEQAAAYYQQQLRAHPVAIDYLKNRGVTGKIAKDFAIGYAPDGWDGLLKTMHITPDVLTQLCTAGLIIAKNSTSYYDRFRDRIMFPIRDRRGRVIAFGGRSLGAAEPKYLNSPETPIFHKGQELYGLYEAHQKQRELPRALVVEGYMDVVALAQYGIHYAVATLGTATSADHIQRLFRLTSEVVFCFDGDAAGQTAARRALEISLPLLQDGWQIRFLILPAAEDPDSLIRKEGLDAFVHRIDHATPLADYFFLSLSKTLDLQSEAGRAQLANLANPLLNKMADTVFKHILFERLAGIVRLGSETLKQIATNKMPKAKQKTASAHRARVANPRRRSTMRVMLALLVQNPQLVHSLPTPEIIQEFTMPGSDLLRELVELLQQTADMTTGTLLEYWREKPGLEQLKQLASWEIGVPMTGIEEELMGAMATLMKMQHEYKADQLLQKARLTVLSEEEKVELQRLISI